MYKIYKDNGRLYAVADGSIKAVPCSLPLVGNTEGLEVGRTYDFMDFQLRLRKFHHNGRWKKELCMNVLSWKEA
jgi:hypothetical protein